MSHELLYTSAEHGLKPGSYGFCTVMATDGLSKALQDRLESLSGYEHPFAVTDMRASLNPVNYSYLIVTVANQRLHLLSRIADAGADYSGRSNKLAHHIVLRPTELPAASPPATLAAPGLCITSFDGTARTLSHRVLPQAIPHPLAICSVWEAVAGDAGWAGYLVQLTLQNGLRPVTIIYPPGCDVLPLVTEAMTLLPAEQQWRTTFSTFFTKLPAGVDCQWRFVLDGTPAADQARRNLQSPPIDLTAAKRIPSEGPLVEAARTGKKPVAEALAARTSTGASTEASAGTKNADPETYRLGTIPSRSINVGSAADDDLFAKRGLSPLAWASIGGGSLAALLIIVGLAIALTTGTGPALPDASTRENTSKRDEVIEKPDLLVNTDQTKKPTQPAQVNEKPIAVPTNPDTATAQVPANQTTTKPLTFEEIVKDIRAKGAVLSLPKRDQGVTGSFGEQELCKIFVEHPSDCELTLVTTETLGDGQPRMYLERENSPSDEQQLWTAVTRAENSVEIKIVPIGRFELKNQSLFFTWDEAPSWTSPFGLLYCKLDVGVGSQKIQCSLTKPTIRVLEHLELNHRKASMPIDIAAGTLSSVKHLRYDLELLYDNWIDSRTGIKAEDSRPLKFELPGDGKTGDTRIELEFRFRAPTVMNDGEFSYRGYVYPTWLRQKERTVWERITRRNDQFPELEPTREGFIVKDFEDYRKRAADQRRLASMNWTRSDATFKQRSREFAKLSDAEKEKQQKALEDLRAEVKYWHEAVVFGDEALLWVGAMEDEFKAIQKSLEVRFTFYLEFPGETKFEQVILVQTNPPPSKRTVKSSSLR